LNWSIGVTANAPLMNKNKNKGNHNYVIPLGHYTAGTGGSYIHFNGYAQRSGIHSSTIGNTGYFKL
jgi:hypothetical protein